LACVLSLVVAGCSQRAEEGPLQGQRAVLVLSSTITIAAPSPLSPIAATVTGVGSLALGAKSEIVTGTAVALSSTQGVQTQPDALLNETWSRATAVLNIA